MRAKRLPQVLFRAALDDVRRSEEAPPPFLPPHIVDVASATDVRCASAAELANQAPLGGAGNQTQWIIQCSILTIRDKSNVGTIVDTQIVLPVRERDHVVVFAVHKEDVKVLSSNSRYAVRSAAQFVGTINKERATRVGGHTGVDARYDLHRALVWRKSAA